MRLWIRFLPSWLVGYNIWIQLIFVFHFPYCCFVGRWVCLNCICLHDLLPAMDFYYSYQFYGVYFCPFLLELVAMYVIIILRFCTLHSLFSIGWLDTLWMVVSVVMGLWKTLMFIWFMRLTIFKSKELIQSLLQEINSRFISWRIISSVIFLMSNKMSLSSTYRI
jgi:hypothetical protein